MLYGEPHNCLSFSNQTRSGATTRTRLANRVSRTGPFQYRGNKTDHDLSGNGQFAAVVEYDGDFEKIFKDYVSSPSVQSFHFKIQKFLEAPPISASASKLNLSGDVFVWDGQQFDTATG